MAITDVQNETREKMERALESAKTDFGQVRTGRINPALFQKIPVDYYGTPTPLAQLASLQVPEARTMIVTPYDKTALKEIEKAIATFPNLGASPTNDGTLVRVTIPELTQERRKEFVKIVRSKGEDAKVQIRNIRRKSKDDLDALKSEVGDDEVARAEKDLESLTKSFIDSIDDALKKKEAELLEV
ncbi:ribosome-recycling factor [Frigoribacterium faeni]|uniref:Ribosome-recycling factor n=2 Tax=Frigoribacterium faeni TaxID=145483 RepID=A0A7W3PHL4_9MICO|nr:ribosome recycling factor [Frigoribacterium faeni]BFF13521.1 ribosome recycling factor [Microbacterium flavescens]GEK81838.1 ribosome-recycling factor [Frigoribacterium faeni]